MTNNPSIHFLYPLNQSVRSRGRLEPIPAVLGREAGYNLDRLPVMINNDKPNNLFINWPER